MQAPQYNLRRACQIRSRCSGSMKVTPECLRCTSGSERGLFLVADCRDQYIPARLNDPLGLAKPATFIEAGFGN